MYKTQESGTVSKNGKRFTDRIKLGKVASTIVGIDFYENKMGARNIVGLQTSYSANGSIKKSVVNMIHDPKMAERVSFQLEDKSDYIKDIELIINEASVIVGIRTTSRNGVSFSAGCSEGTRRPLNIPNNGHPACFFGSFCHDGLELFGC